MSKRDRAFFSEARSRLNVISKGKAAGQGYIAFEYYRYFGTTQSSKTSIVRVTVSPKPTAQ